MRAESQCQIRLEKMTTRGEYRKQWNSYLNNLSTQISDFEWFESEVRSGQRPHVSVRLQDCEEDSLYLSITRHERTSGRAYIFRLESCPFCAYQLFTIELSPSKELMARGLWHLLSLIGEVGLIGDPQNKHLQRGRILTYQESVYLDEAKPGWHEMAYAPPLCAATVSEDINQWVSVAERAITLSQTLDFNPFRLLSQLTTVRDIPLDIFDNLETVVMEFAANSYEVIAHWVDRKFYDYPRYRGL